MKFCQTGRNSNKFPDICLIDREKGDGFAADCILSHEIHQYYQYIAGMPRLDLNSVGLVSAETTRQDPALTGIVVTASARAGRPKPTVRRSTERTASPNGK